MKKRIALAMAVVALIGVVTMPVNDSLAYSEDPLAKKNFEEFGAAAAETEATEAETIPASATEETVAAETETVVVETVAELPTEEATHPTEPVDPNAPKGHNGVPLYFQTDYPDDVYGEGTVASNGCSAACLAMVATYLTGHEYLPDEMARYFGDSAENNIA